MMDIALQTLGATRVATDLAGGQTARSTLVVPVRFAGVHVYGDITRGVCAVGSLAAADGRLVGEVVLTDPDGQPLLVIDEVEMAVLGSHGGANGTHRAPVRVGVGVRTAGNNADTTTGALLLIGDVATGDPLLSGLQSSLRDRRPKSSWSPRTTKRSYVRRSPEPTSPGTASSWSARPDPIDESLPDQAQLELAQTRTLLIARVVETLTRMGVRKSPRLWIVTRGAQQLDPGESVTLAQTGASGTRAGADIRAFRN